jgi:hypothetical protein
VQRRAGGQVAGGRVDRDQVLGPVQEERAGQDREHHESSAERRAFIQVAARRRWPGPPVAAGGSSWTGSTLRGGWSSVGRRCLIRAYPIKGVISDTLASISYR